MNEQPTTLHIDKTVHIGRPSDISGRSAKELRTYDFLEDLGIAYQRLDHDAHATIDACHEVDQAFQTEICKNLFLRNAQKTAFYLLMLPGQKKFRTADLSRQINSARLSFAEPEFMMKYLDITPGSVSVLGLMNDRDNQVHLLIDKDVINQPYMGCHPCINTSSLKIQITDILNKFLPAVNHDYTVVNLPE